MPAAKAPEALPPIYRGREQTFIKHLLLRRYLERVARNVLWAYQEFVFVDGFSGPWRSNSPSYADTSFGIAIDQLRKVRDDLLEQGHPRSVRCVFVEKRTSAFRKLEAAAASAGDLDALALPGRFEDQVDAVAEYVGKAFSLTSIDPTGWSFDLQRLAPVLRHEPGEVLINFMYEHFKRFLDDERPDIRRSQVLPFGDPQWRERLAELEGRGLSREEAVLELFRGQVKALGGFKYVLSARVRHRLAEKSHFYIVYGTRHEKGLIEFRNVEKKAMEAEEHCRIEAKQDSRALKTGQGSLFGATEINAPKTLDELRQPEIERARQWLSRVLAARGVLTYREALRGTLERFSVTQPELGDVLVALANAQEVTLEGMGDRQRKPGPQVTIRGASRAA
jgi:three-Cys-motif partner protein